MLWRRRYERECSNHQVELPPPVLLALWIVWRCGIDSEIHDSVTDVFFVCSPSRLTTTGVSLQNVVHYNVLSVDIRHISVAIERYTSVQRTVRVGAPATEDPDLQIQSNRLMRAADWGSQILLPFSRGDSACRQTGRAEAYGHANASNKARGGILRFPLRSRSMHCGTTPAVAPQSVMVPLPSLSYAIDSAPVKFPLCSEVISCACAEMLRITIVLTLFMHVTRRFLSPARFAHAPLPLPHTSLPWFKDSWEGVEAPTGLAPESLFTPACLMSDARLIALSIRCFAFWTNEKRRRPGEQTTLYSEMARSTYLIYGHSSIWAMQQVSKTASQVGRVGVTAWSSSAPSLEDRSRFLPHVTIAFHLSSREVDDAGDVCRRSDPKPGRPASGRPWFKQDSYVGAGRPCGVSMRGMPLLLGA
ncbi:hypothetical protein IWZ00DRAFT_145777 [Phyllosticta capitalensis]